MYTFRRSLARPAVGWAMNGIKGIRLGLDKVIRRKKIEWRRSTSARKRNKANQDQGRRVPESSFFRGSTVDIPAKTRSKKNETEKWRLSLKINHENSDWTNSIRNVTSGAWSVVFRDNWWIRKRCREVENEWARNRTNTPIPVSLLSSRA